MIRLLLLTLCILGFSPTLWAAANCAHSHSWQCSGHTSQSSTTQAGVGITSTGHSPSTSTTNQPLGTASTGGSQPMIALVPAMQVPPQPPAQQVPQPMPMQVPPQIAQQTPTPMQVPPQPPAQQVPVISQPHPGHVTGQQLTTGPTSGGAGTSVTKPAGTVSKIKTEHLPGKPVPQRPQVALVPGKQPPSTLGPTQPVQPHHVVLAKPNPVSVAASTWTTEITEPGLENRQVELYRSEDAEEVLYQDVIPMDKTGFHLTVFGLRAPSYATAP